MSTIKLEPVTRSRRGTAIAAHLIEFHRLMASTQDAGFISVTEIVESHVPSFVGANSPAAWRPLIKSRKAAAFFGDMLVVDLMQADIERFIDEICAEHPKPSGSSAVQVRNVRALSCATLLLDALMQRCVQVAPRLKPIAEDLKARRRAHHMASLPKRPTTPKHRELRAMPLKKKSGGH